MMDMANTGVARGKIYLARQRRERIPEGWAIDADGRPTTDPQAAIDGIILPMAGHKGYAIAVIVDLLSGVLTGSGFLSAVHSPYTISMFPVTTHSGALRSDSSSESCSVCRA